MVFYISLVEFWWEVLLLGTDIPYHYHRFLGLESASELIFFYPFHVCVRKYGSERKICLTVHSCCSHDPSSGLWARTGAPPWTFWSLQLCSQKVPVKPHIHRAAEQTDICSVLSSCFYSSCPFWGKAVHQSPQNTVNTHVLFEIFSWIIMNYLVFALSL